MLSQTTAIVLESKRQVFLHTAVWLPLVCIVNSEALKCGENKICLIAIIKEHYGKSLFCLWSDVPCCRNVVQDILGSDPLKIAQKYHQYRYTKKQKRLHVLFLLHTCSHETTLWGAKPCLMRMQKFVIRSVGESVLCLLHSQHDLCPPLTVPFKSAAWIWMKCLKICQSIWGSTQEL